MLSVPTSTPNTAAPNGVANQPTQPATTPAPTVGTSQPVSNPVIPTIGNAQNSHLNTNLSPPAWPTDLPITEKFMNDPTWPANLRLDLEKANWNEWSYRMRNTAQRCGFCHWLNATYAPPDINTEAGQHYIWQLNDDSLRGFILNAIAQPKCKVIENCQTSNDMWEALRQHHEKCSVWHQLLLVKQLLEMWFTVGTPLNQTVEKMDDLYNHMSNMGPLDWPTFKTYAFINALGGEFEYMQSQIHASANDPGFSANTIVARILQESDLIKN